MTVISFFRAMPMVYVNGSGGNGLRGRFTLMTLCFVAAFAIVAARLAALGFVARPDDGGLAALPVSTALHRPTIIDRKGRILATDILVPSLYADPQSIRDIDDTIEQLSSVLPDLNTDVLRHRLRSGGRFAWIQRELTPRQQADIHELGLPGIAFVDEYHRVADERWKYFRRDLPTSALIGVARLSHPI